MKRPTFFEGVGVAIVASLGGAILFRALIPLSDEAPFRAVVAILALGYVVYLISRSPERVGRVTTMLMWGLLAAVLWLVDLPLSLYLFGHVGAIWLVRGLYFHAGVLAATLDFGLMAFALAAGFWALSLSASLLLALWTFFLVQASFVAIPFNFSQRRVRTSTAQSEDSRFEEASRIAEAALRRLSSTH